MAFGYSWRPPIARGKTNNRTDNAGVLLALRNPCALCGRGTLRFDTVEGVPLHFTCIKNYRTSQEQLRSSNHEQRDLSG